MKTILRTVAVLLFSFSLLAEEAPRVAVLCYHEVEKDSHTRFSLSLDRFTRQLDWMLAAGFEVISLDELGAYLKGERASLPKKSLVITVDDGWRCAYTEIFPEMKKRGLPFSLFVYPKFVNKGGHSLTWAELREMSDNGVSIESHTMSHAFLARTRHRMGPSEYSKWLRNELAGSKRVIEANIGKPVRFLAYPYGDYNHYVAQKVEAAGYDGALTTEDGFLSRDTNRFRIKRFCVDSGTTAVVLARWLGGKSAVDSIQLARAGGRIMHSDHELQAAMVLPAKDATRTRREGQPAASLPMKPVLASVISTIPVNGRATRAIIPPSAR